MARRSPGRLVRTLAGVALASVALTGCGGDVGDTIASRLPTALPTLPSLPTALPTLPSLPTRPPAETAPPPETTAPAPPAATTPPVAAPTPAPPVSTTPPPATPTASPPAEAEESPGVPPVAGEDEDAVAEDGAFGWWWLVILLLGAAVTAIGVLLLRRRKARAEWDEGVDRAAGEATWVADELIPNILGQGSHGRAGVWTIGRQRVLTLERTLEDLVAGTPDPAAARPVAALSSAVQAFRSVLDQADGLPDFGGFSTTAALRQARLEIEETLRLLQPTEGEPAD